MWRKESNVFRCYDGTELHDVDGVPYSVDAV